MASKAPKLKVVTNEDWSNPHIRLIAKNGKTVFSTETFPTRTHARRALKRIVEIVRDPGLEVDEG